MTHAYRFIVAVALGAGLTATSPSAFAQQPPFFEALNQDGNAGQNLRGLVDLHAHPMAHLGFGGKLVHGAPDAQIEMPPGMFSCHGGVHFPANIDEAIPDCDGTHGALLGSSNPCWNGLRSILIHELEATEGGQSVHGPTASGSPDFLDWPNDQDFTHQQMWVDWTLRAKDGGLRVMVALAVNSVTLARGLDGSAPFDDVTNVRKQFDEMRALVARHPADMEIADTPADLRRIVGQDKLAIVLGAEVDNIGNLNDEDIMDLDRERIVGAIQALHHAGARYVLPIHLIDNRFGGTAVYKDLFNVANVEETGGWYNLRCASPSSQITTRIAPPSAAIKAGLVLALGRDPTESPNLPSWCLGSVGHANMMGLTRMGRTAIQEMMRLGMMIDIDHMSERTVASVIDLAMAAPSGPYPLNSGHNNQRPNTFVRNDGSIGGGGSEAQRTRDEYAAIQKTGGMAGVGWSKQEPTEFWARLSDVMSAMGGPSTSALALGTDVNGLVLPPVGSGTNSSTFPHFQTGNRVWDYAVDGVANYGLMPEYLADVHHVGGHTVVAELFEGAEHFARMWQQSAMAMTVPPPMPGAPSQPAAPARRTVPAFDTGEVAPQALLAGDREFDGNGPIMRVEVDLDVSSDERSVEATIYFHARETVPDHSETEIMWTETLLTLADPSERIATILADTECVLDNIISGKAGTQIVAGTHSDNEQKRLYCDAEFPIREIMLVGDTGGDDISDDSDPHDDTRIRVVFDEFEVELQ